jgi:hypothetical protein
VLSTSKENLVVAQAAKQYREQIAVALLAVAVVFIGCGLALLFKSYDFDGLGFPEKSALDGYLFSHPVLIASIVVAVLLVAGWGEPSAHARTVVLTAVGVGAVALVFAVITWIAAFSAQDGGYASFADVQGAGKVVGAFIALAQIALLVLALFLAGMALQALPRPLRAEAQWAYQPGWAPAPDWQQQQWAGHQQPAGQPSPGASPAAPWAVPPSAGPGGQQYGHGPQPAGRGPSSPYDAGWPGPGAQRPGQAPPAGPSDHPSSVAGDSAAATQASNAELYWRSAVEQTGAPDDSSPTSHLAADPASESTEGASASWSQDAGPSAAELTASSAGLGEDDQSTPLGEWAEPADADRHQPDHDDGHDDDDDAGKPSDDGTDTSGWWRPSSTS